MVEEYYNCFECGRWKYKKDLRRISYSTGKDAVLCMICICKECSPKP